MKLIRRTNSNNFPSLFNDVFNNDWFESQNQKYNNFPAVNVKEDDKGFAIEMAAPGMLKEEFNIEVNQELLTVSYEHKTESAENDAGYSRKEFSLNSFSRSFVLPETVDAEKIKASYKDGILALSIPKREEARKKAPQKIKIS